VKPDLSTIPPRWCAVLVLLAIVPLLYPAVPPLTDLPGHMSRFMVQMDGGRSVDIARWYTFEWNLLPNLGTDLIAWVLEPLIGLEPTMKAIGILIVGLQVGGYLLLSRAAHGRVMVTALFAIPLALGNPFQYGFINFVLGTALATLALALWISPAMAERARLRWAVFCFVASAIWVCHLAAWALLCILVGCCELVARYERSGRPGWSLLTGFLASACLLVPQVLSMAWPHPTEHLPNGRWFLMAVKLYHLVNVLSDRWEPWDYACGVALIAVIVLFWRSPLVVLHKGLALAAVVLLALYFVMPEAVYGSAYADMRLTPTIFALALICVRPLPEMSGGHRRIIAVAAMVFMLTRIGGNTVSMAMWDRQIRQETAVIEAVPRGSQLLTFIAQPCRDLWMQNRIRDTHAASYALTRRHAFANDQWQMPGGQLMRIHNPAVGPFYEAGTGSLVGEQCQGFNQLQRAIGNIPDGIPLLWIVWHTPEVPLAGWQEIRRSGDSVLYRRHAP